jgi:hypothetical protein
MADNHVGSLARMGTAGLFAMSGKGVREGGRRPEPLVLWGGTATPVRGPCDGCGGRSTGRS